MFDKITFLVRPDLFLQIYKQHYTKNATLRLETFLDFFQKKRQKMTVSGQSKNLKEKKKAEIVFFC